MAVFNFGNLAWNPFLAFDSSAWQLFFLSFPGSWPASAAVIGAILASFFGVVVDRLPRAVGWDRENPDPSINLRGPSKCDACRVRLNPAALIPVLGWLWYRGKCFNCGSKVPGIYPLMEGICALLSAIIAGWFGPTELGIWALFALWSCICLSWMDWREHWLMDRITIPLLMAGLLASPFEQYVLLRNEGMFLCAVVLWAIFAWKGFTHGVETMSGGDLVMAAVAGAWLGLPVVPAYLGITGVVFALYTIPMRIKGEKWAPMGPALCGALIICLLFRPWLLIIPDWIAQ